MADSKFRTTNSPAFNSSTVIRKGSKWDEYAKKEAQDYKKAGAKTDADATELGDDMAGRRARLVGEGRGIMPQKGISYAKGGKVRR